MGRNAELDELTVRLERAQRGQHQLVFITGEPGSGKSALVEHFLQSNRHLEPWFACGYCFEQYGSTESYAPMLDILAQWCRDDRCGSFAESLRDSAPAWYMQLPTSARRASQSTPPESTFGANAERMLRRIVALLESLATDRMLLLVLEDLHWSDFSTLDIISKLARNRLPARLMLIGTYRPVDVILSRHPVRSLHQDLQQHQFCSELPMQPLDVDDVRHTPSGPRYRSVKK